MGVELIPYRIPSRVQNAGLPQPPPPPPPQTGSLTRIALVIDEAEKGRT